MIAITTRFLGPTNTKGARIVAETANGHRIVRPYDCAGSSTARHAQVACELARSLQWSPEVLFEGGTKNGSVFVFAGSPCWNVEDGSASVETSAARDLMSIGNREGLTYGEWLAAARVPSTPGRAKAWRDGEDPTDWSA